MLNWCLNEIIETFFMLKVHCLKVKILKMLDDPKEKECLKMMNEKSIACPCFASVIWEQKFD